MPPAARITDMHVCPMVTGVVPHVGGPIVSPGGPTVLIGGLPAATVGSACVCVGPPDIVMQGSTTVMICGKPAVRLDDPNSHGGSIMLGCLTVIIGGKNGSSMPPPLDFLTPALQQLIKPGMTSRAAVPALAAAPNYGRGRKVPLARVARK